jgi:SAM-dependent methyltransferase
MDWRDDASQLLRFDLLLGALGNPEEGRLLDVGCGNGELLAWLRRRGSRLVYHGIDVSTAMIEAFQRRHGVACASLASPADLCRSGARFDWAVASGTFNVKQEVDDERWARYVRRTVADMFALCGEGLAFNVLSTCAEIRRPHLYHFAPRSVPALARRCGTRFFRVDCSSRLWELTVALLHREAA